MQRVKVSEYSVGQEIVFVDYGNGYGPPMLTRGYKVEKILNTRIVFASGRYKRSYVIDSYGDVIKEVGREVFRSETPVPADSEQMEEIEKIINLHNLKLAAKEKALRVSSTLGFSVEAAKEAVAALHAWLAAEEE